MFGETRSAGAVAAMFLYETAAGRYRLLSRSLRVKCRKPSVMRTEIELAAWLTEMIRREVMVEVGHGVADEGRGPDEDVGLAGEIAVAVVQKRGRCPATVIDGAGIRVAIAGEVAGGES